MPDNIVWALLAVAVFARENRMGKTKGDHFLKWRAGRLGSDEYQFKLQEWWGRAEDFRAIICRYEQIKAEIRELSNLISAPKTDQAVE